MRRRLMSLGLVAFLGLGTAAFAQVTGVVNDANGFPESDAEVIVKGTGKVAITDENGNFDIDAKVGDVLVINGKEFKVTSTQLGVLKAKADSPIDLAEVSIIGGIKLDAAQKIGSYETIKREAFENTPVASIDEVLNGRVAGLNFSTGGGQPGSANIIAIRGASSFVGTTNPLYVIDGVVVGKGSDNAGLMTSFNPLSSIDPNQIENVTVLKDASATALYGARGANGVIVVTTKRGKFNQPTKFSFSSEFSVQDVAFDKANYMNADEFLQWGGLAIFNSSKMMSDLGLSTRDEAVDWFTNDYLEYDGVTNENWRKAVQRNSASVRTYNFSIQGGGENTNFRAGLSYYDNTPLTLNSKFDRLSTSLAVDHRASDKFKLGANINFTTVKNKTYLDGGAFSNPWLLQWAALPTTPVYNPDGSYNTNLIGAGKHNPVAVLSNNHIKGNISTVVASVTGNYNFAKNFNFDSNFGAQYQLLDESQWASPLYGDGVDVNGRLYNSLNQYLDWNWVNTVSYQNTFANRHNLQVYVGMEYQEHKGNLKFSHGTDFLLSPPVMSNAGTILAATGNKLEWAQYSYFSRLNYVLDGKYTVSGQIRYDANSTLGANERDGVFWSLGGSWNAGKDINSDVVSNLILRANYGELGNIPYADSWGTIYNSITQMGIAGMYNESNSLGVLTIGNPNLKWETTKQLNIGVDFGFANNIVSGSIDVYNKKTVDAIFPTSISSETPSPVGSYLSNLGVIKNQGIEGILTVRPVSGEFNWSLTGNISYNKSEVGKMMDSNAIYMTGALKAIQEGRQFGEFYTYGWAGVDPTNGDGLFYTDETKTATTNKRSAAKQYFQGKSPFPTYMAGLRSDMSWKGVSLSMFFSGAFDYSVMDAWQSYSINDGEFGYYNQNANSLYDSWTPQNTGASNPKQVWGGNGSGSNLPSSRWIKDGDFIRLKEVKLAYSFKDVLKNTGIDNLTVYLRGQNLVTWVFDKTLTFDPETNSNAYSYGWQGKGVFDYTSPIMKSYSLGISIDF